MINISQADKAEVLAALYNAAKPAGGLGLVHARKEPMTVEQARALIKRITDDTGFERRHGLYFDYVWGRPLKVDLSEDALNVSLYDRDQGVGAGLLALANVAGVEVKPDPCEHCQRPECRGFDCPERQL